MTITGPVPRPLQDWSLAGPQTTHKNRFLNIFKNLNLFIWFVGENSELSPHVEPGFLVQVVHHPLPALL